MRDLNNSEDILDVRDIIARVEELEDDRQATEDAASEEASKFRKQGRDLSAIVAWDEEHGEELATLSALLADMAGNGGDEEWRGDWYPATLIRDSYFTDYAQELVEDCGYIAKDFPNWIEIDWEATARNVRMDYTSTEFDGVTYWYR